MYFLLQGVCGWEIPKGRGLGFKTELSEGQSTTNTIKKLKSYLQIYIKKKKKNKHHKRKKNNNLQTTMSTTIIFHLILKGSCSM